MDSLQTRIRTILARQPASALPITELISSLASEYRGFPPDPRSLMRQLRSAPGLFRIVTPLGGAWTASWSGARIRESGRPRSLADIGIEPEPWVVLLDPPTVRPGSHDLGARLRESLACLGRTLDGQSATSVARWIRIATEARRLGVRIPEA